VQSAVPLRSSCSSQPWSPLPLGAARPLAWDILALAVAGLLLASLPLAAALNGRERPLAGPALLLLIVALFALLQTVSWTPSRWQNPLWDQARASLEEPLLGSIAVDRGAALVRLLRLLSEAGSFYLAFLLALDARRAAALLKLIGVSGSLYAVYGLATYWTGNRTLLWMPKWAYPEDLTGPFVNRNSCAAYLGLAILALLCWLLRGLETPRPSGGGWRTALASGLELLGSRAWLLACLFVLAVALLLTHSRGGFLSLLGALLVLALALAATRGSGKARRLRRIALLGAMIALGLVVSGGPTIARLLGTDILGEERLAVYRQTLNAIADYPLLGVGLGSFAEIFPLYRTSDIANLYDLAHDDYLETMLELGLPAAACLFAALLWLAAICVRGLRIRRRDIACPAAGLAATALVALDSIVDFSLQIPAVAVTYMVILGIAVAQSRSSRVGVAQSVKA
jgi:O-antigen ligase